MHVLHEYVKGLVVFGVAERITQPFGKLCCDILACLDQLAKLGDYSQETMPDKVFWLAYLGLLLDLSYLVHQYAFRHCGSFSHFILAWMDLFDAA